MVNDFESSWTFNQMWHNLLAYVFSSYLLAHYLHN